MVVAWHVSCSLSQLLPPARRSLLPLLIDNTVPEADESGAGHLRELTGNRCGMSASLAAIVSENSKMSSMQVRCTDTLCKQSGTKRAGSELRHSRPAPKLPAAALCRACSAMHGRNQAGQICCCSQWP